MPPDNDPGFEPAPPVHDEPFAGTPTTSSSATIALVVGVVGLVIFGVLLGPLAFYLGGRAEREINESGGRLTGAGRARAAKILGVIGFLVWVAIVVINLSVRS